MTKSTKLIAFESTSHTAIPPVMLAMIMNTANAKARMSDNNRPDVCCLSSGDRLTSAVSLQVAIVSTTGHEVLMPNQKALRSLASKYCSRLERESLPTMSIPKGERDGLCKEAVDPKLYPQENYRRPEMLPLGLASVFLAFLIFHESESLDSSDLDLGDAEGDLEVPELRDSICYPSPTHSLNLPGTTFSLTQASRDWWCPQQKEFSWLGLATIDCPSRDEMTSTFGWMRRAKRARYVRLYGGCDNANFDNDVIEAAAQPGVGIYALIWFGFDNDDKWKGRKERLLQAIKDNPKAPYVIRAVTCGSEPLFDQVLPVEGLVAQIQDLKQQLSPFGIQVTLSEMPAGYQAHNDTPEIFEAVDFVSLHSFGFFEQNATTADNAQISIRRDVRYGLEHGRGKKVVITQTGWPSNTDVWKANSPNAIASIEQETLYFQMLDRQCRFFKTNRISWFSHGDTLSYENASLSGSFIALALVAQASAHLSLISIYGSNNVVGHGFGVVRDLESSWQISRQKGIAGDAGGDSTVFETGTDNPTPACGRTPEFGPVDIPAWLSQAEGDGLPAAHANMSVVADAFQVNRDGGGPMSCEFNEDATAASWKPMVMILNQAGNSGIQNEARTNQTVVMSFPQGAKCTGGWSQAACIVRCRTGVNKRFGGCFAVKLSGSTSAAVTLSTSVTSSLLDLASKTNDTNSTPSVGSSTSQLSDEQLSSIADQVVIQMKKQGLIVAASASQTDDASSVTNLNVTRTFSTLASNSIRLEQHISFRERPVYQQHVDCGRFGS
ncbi:hypothetical protein H4Q26_002517 [Puccinia striiformis f. sp. tritici PST-130]|nr:hypothetical protein H4Q26_002517 [Puccinia striiformis f. sp. tritici PST-130]